MCPGKTTKNQLPEQRREVMKRMQLLNRLGGRVYQVREDQAVYGNGKNDFDLDKEQPQTLNADHQKAGVRLAFNR